MQLWAHLERILVKGAPQSITGTHLLHTHGTELVPYLDALIERLASDVRAKEPARKRVARAVGIHNFVIRDRRHGEHLGVAPAHEHGLARALRDDDRARAVVSLGIPRDADSDLAHLLGARVEYRFIKGERFGVVANHDVGVVEGFVELGREEFGDERCGEVKYKRLDAPHVNTSAIRRRRAAHLFLLGRVFAQREYRVEAVREEEALDVKHLGGLHKRGDRRRFQI